jgi:CubicO group peptidase (beta-lactamase class C family)
VKAFILYLAAAAAALPIDHALAAPGAHWAEMADPVAAGWSADGLAAVEREAADLGATAVMVVGDGEVVVQTGDITRKVNVASVRKSFLGALYGVAVGEGRIAIDATLAVLAIDDRPPALTDAEKQARVADLLSARSGVYHPAALETAEMQAGRPPRGSHPPGTFWYYNNWDFNTLGGIYRQLTGEDIYESFARRIAGPIGMEDFSPADGRYVADAVSLYPAYLFRMNARDMARFGELYRDGGTWNDRQVVPTDWVRTSTLPKTETSEPPPRGFGFLWWTLPSDVYGLGAAATIGNGGQFIVLVPARHLVLVETVDVQENPGGVSTERFLAFVRDVMAAAPAD